MKKSFVRLLILILVLSLLTGAVMLYAHHQQNTSDHPLPQEKSSVPVGQSQSSVPQSPDQSVAVQEMRGVWIPYMSLQLSEQERNELSFRKKIQSMLDTCVSNRINTIIVQVRPFGDAIYPSSYFPWSHIISGTQGKGVDFDPLSIILEEAHSRQLAVHGWINPFRISTGQTPPALSEDNPYIKWQKDRNTHNDSNTFSYDGGIYYNPASAEVRKLIIDGVKELAQNYELDGIQIDDYFYPSDQENFDHESYQQYLQTLSQNAAPLNLSQWRKTNINMLVSGIYSSIHHINPRMVFGISPQCNFDNNEKLSADITSWSRFEGYADYLCPQLYVSLQHPVFPFRELADKWKDTVTNQNTRLYFGLGLYKAGTDADSGSWLNASDNLRQEVEYLRKLGIGGFMLYAFDQLSADTSQQELQNLMPIL